MLKEFEENQIMTIDLHDYSVTNAKQKLQLTIKYAPKEIREIIVIHGYHGGTALQEMVRRNFKNNRIERKILSLNPGVTSLILKYNN